MSYAENAIFEQGIVDVSQYDIFISLDIFIAD